jgi:heptosyltransferase II
MKILIELPTWLGDTVMSTPAIENILRHYPEAKITLIGSKIATEITHNHPKIIKSIILDKDLMSLYRVSKKLDHFDFFISFRNSFRSRFFKFFVKSPDKFHFKKNSYKGQHQVQKYNSFVCRVFKINEPAGMLNLYSNNANFSYSRPTLGINPGASYGSAKRWAPENFAEVAFRLSKKYDIYIFGGENEKDAAYEIEKLLLKYGVKNYRNLSGKTSIDDLVMYISKLNLFITGDSGPMHIAASFKIPTVSIFGPTNYIETSQWMNINSTIVKKTLDCQPCMKRTCPLGHHNCMKLIKPDEVLQVLR